jgi:hypothetical protein
LQDYWLHPVKLGSTALNIRASLFEADCASLRPDKSEAAFASQASQACAFFDQLLSFSSTRIPSATKADICQPIDLFRFVQARKSPDLAGAVKNFSVHPPLSQSWRMIVACASGAS